MVVINGSVLTKSIPRDLDVLLVVPDEKFEHHYMPVSLWVEQGQTGLWDDNRFRWGSVCIKVGKILQSRIKSKLPIDLKIIPQTQLPRFLEDIE